MLPTTKAIQASAVADVAAQKRRPPHTTAAATIRTTRNPGERLPAIAKRSAPATWIASSRRDERATVPGDETGIVPTGGKNHRPDGREKHRPTGRKRHRLHASKEASSRRDERSARA